MQYALMGGIVEKAFIFATRTTMVFIVIIIITITRTYNAEDGLHIDNFTYVNALLILLYKLHTGVQYIFLRPWYVSNYRAPMCIIDIGAPHFNI